MNDDITPKTSAASPGFFRRLAAMFYDWFLLIAVILVAVSLFTIAADLILGQEGAQQLLLDPVAKLFYQFYLLSVAALFYLWFWTHGGQTLGMKVWKLKVVSGQLQTINVKMAVKRLLLAVISCLPLGLGLIWMLFDRDNLTLYDRWSGTRLVMTQAR